VDQDDGVTLSDALCILNTIGGDFSACSYDECDLHPCGGNGVVDLLDVLAALAAAARMADPCCDHSTPQTNKMAE
jgi:hypothetical protein